MKLSSEINIPLAFSKNRNENSIDKEDSKKPQIAVFDFKSDQTDAPWQVTKRPKITYSKRVSTPKLKTTKSTVKCSNIHSNEDYSMFDFTDDFHSNNFTIPHKNDFSDLKEKSKEKVEQVKILDSSKEKIHGSCLYCNITLNFTEKYLCRKKKSIISINIIHFRKIQKKTSLFK